MEPIFAYGGGLAIVLFMILLAILWIVWIVLPFAVFGIKKRLDALLDEARTMNQNLRDIRSEIGRQQSGVPSIRAER